MKKKKIKYSVVPFDLDLQPYQYSSFSAEILGYFLVGFLCSSSSVFVFQFTIYRSLCPLV